jgi:hypothetical protein
MGEVGKGREKEGKREKEEEKKGYRMMARRR